MTEAQTAVAEPLVLDAGYAALPDCLYARVTPAPVSDPRLLRLNRPLAAALSLDAEALAAPEGVAALAGNRVPEGAAPVALAYAGHQFGNYVPLLGDGRAVLLGDRLDRNGVRRDIQLKGAGRTPFSRTGDGRAALGPVLREYVVSEAMAALGIPTTRALAMVATGEPVRRQRAEPGAILTRVAASHLRVGTFQYVHALDKPDSLRALADYVIARHYPELQRTEAPYRGLLAAVVERSADLIAQWLQVGFIHGVMNTDNVSVAGETLDYGPCAFLDAYHPATVFSSIDLDGRYAYNRQPQIGLWNLSRFAECLLPLLADEEETAVERAKAALNDYAPRFEARYRAGMAAKIGLAECRDGDLELVNDLLKRMAEQGADFTLTFRHLAEAADGDTAAAQSRFRDAAVFDAWAERWHARLGKESRDAETRRSAMRTVNPAFIPRNHRVQQAIEAAEAGDLRPLGELLTVVTRPYDDHPELAHYGEAPAPHEVVHRTFCGT